MIKELYMKFREELDSICVPEILKEVNAKEIKDEGKTAGILCTREDGYIDCIYILPEHRRKGLAKKAVLEYYYQNRMKMVRLHIINKNAVAMKFWNSLFSLEKIDGNEIDTLYYIMGVKDNDTKV